MSADGASLLVPPARVERWIENFRGRHGTTALTVVDGHLEAAASDGSSFRMSLPFSTRYAGLPDASAFAAAARSAPPADWGVLLVRKGGFAVARLSGTRTTASKVGQRHVQGRTKAGGQSQQRFARRRDNQARQAYEAAADHAVRLLGSLAGPLVTGGDAAALEAVLEDPRLRRLEVAERRLPVPDPRRAVLEQAVADACAAGVTVHNSDGPSWPGRSGADGADER